MPVAVSPLKRFIFLQSCLLAVGKNQVWAGSLDTTIYVINTLTGKGKAAQIKLLHTLLIANWFASYHMVFLTNLC